jgi:hypothetical protein
LVRSHIVKEVQVEDIGTVTDVDTVEALRHAQALLDARG